MALRKFKLGDVVSVAFNDIHSNSYGWISLEDCLKETPAKCFVSGKYLGITKDKEMAISPMVETEGGQHGIRIYIPLGCITSAKKLA